MKKRILSRIVMVVLLGMLVCILTSCGAKEQIPIPKIIDGVYVYDEENILDDTLDYRLYSIMTENRLNQALTELEEKTGVKIVIITVKSLLNRDVGDYANVLFDSLELGKKDNSVLLLASKNEQKIKLKAGKGLQGCLSDSRCDNILYYFSYNKFEVFDGTIEYVAYSAIIALCKEYNVNVDRFGPSDGVAEKTPVQWWQYVLGGVGLIIFLFILYLTTDEKYKVDITEYSNEDDNDSSNDTPYYSDDYDDPISVGDEESGKDNEKDSPDEPKTYECYSAIEGDGESVSSDDEESGKGNDKDSLDELKTYECYSALNDDDSVSDDEKK